MADLAHLDGLIDLIVEALVREIETEERESTQIHGLNFERGQRMTPQTPETCEHST